MRRALACLRHPAATLLLACLLTWSLWRVCTREARWSTIGGALSGFVERHIASKVRARPAPLGAPRGTWFTIRDQPWVLHAGEWKVFDPDPVNLAGGPVPMSPASLPSVDVSMSGGFEFAGIYAITREREAVRVHMTHVGGPEVTHGQLAELRRAYVTARARAGGTLHLLEDSTWEPLKTGDVVVVRRRYWRGYAHSAAALLGLVALVCSARYSCSPRWRRARRRERRFSRGRCPGCRYPIAGLVGSTCPECGATLPTAPSARGQSPDRRATDDPDGPR